MSKSPVVYSRKNQHVLGWFLTGKEQPQEPVTYYALRMAAKSALYGMVKTATVTSGLEVMFSSGSGHDVIDAGIIRDYQTISVMNRGHNQTNDHVTAEIRDGLASGWTTFEADFSNTVSAFMRPADLHVVVGHLIVPRPDDFTPEIARYMPMPGAPRAAVA
jgi:hypothetical protein